MEVYVDDEAKLTLHGLQQHYVKLKENEKNKKLFELLDVLEFNQVINERRHINFIHKNFSWHEPCGCVTGCHFRKVGAKMCGFGNPIDWSEFPSHWHPPWNGTRREIVSLPAV